MEKKIKKILLHRGYKGKYPENSKLSFEMALKEKRNFETDIRVSKDGICFMIHDDSIDNLFNGVGKIKDNTSEYLFKFNYKEDATQKLCTLKEMCELIKKYPSESLIFIHMKELGDIDETMNVIKKYDFHKRLRFFAVDEIEEWFRKIMRKKYPEYKLGLYLPENSANYDEKHFKDFDFIWADEITIKWMTKEKVDFAHRFGKPFYAISPELISVSVFNTNIEKRWEELMDANVDGICTDLPERFLEFVKTRL